MTIEHAITARGTFRDVAEAAGLRPGRLFRSSELSRLSEEGRQRLAELGITDVADLRSPREVERRGPGLVPDGVERAPAAVPRPVRRRRGGAARCVVREDDDREARRRRGFDRGRAVHDRGVPALPHPGRCPPGGAPGDLAAGRRPAGDHALLRRQGPHRLHRGRGAGGRRGGPGRDRGGLPAQQRRGGTAARADPGVDARTRVDDTRGGDVRRGAAVRGGARRPRGVPGRGPATPSTRTTARCTVISSPPASPTSSSPRCARRCTSELGDATAVS